MKNKMNYESLSIHQQSDILSACSFLCQRFFDMYEDLEIKGGKDFFEKRNQVVSYCNQRIGEANYITLQFNEDSYNSHILDDAETVSFNKTSTKEVLAYLESL